MRKILLFTLVCNFIDASNALPISSIPKGLSPKHRAKMAARIFIAEGTMPTNTAAAQLLGASSKVLNKASQADRIEIAKERLREKLAARQAAKK